MAKRRALITKILTLGLLAVFSIALTPWSLVHEHKSEIPAISTEKYCAHKLHIKSQADNCLICKAHFEKTDALPQACSGISMERPLSLNVGFKCGSAYTALISASLRGPPAIG